mgnify:CR=1 FL=1
MKDKIKDGGPAFAAATKSCVQKGMSLRDYFAAKAMQSVYLLDGDNLMTHDDISKAAYDQADSMLKERERC